MTRLGGVAARSAQQVARWMNGAIAQRPLAELRRLWRDKRGVTALEFALVFPIVMLFILGTLELDRVMYMQLQLQAAVADASRYGMTGNASADAFAQVACPTGYNPPMPIDTTYEINCRLQQRLCPNATVPTCTFDVTRLSISITSFSDLQDLGSNSAPSSGVGLANQLVQYHIKYTVPFATGTLSRILGGTIPISGNAIVYNEPFNGSSLGS
jgi:Flp pilus assembly protein TadG